MILPFGKYKGQEIDSVPTAYLKWLEENATILSPSQRDAINQEIKCRTSDETLGRSVESPSYRSLEEMVYESLAKWYRCEVTVGRIIVIQNKQEAVDASLCNHIKSELPKLQALWRAQKKAT
jgi:hypothetical protein